MEGHYILPLWFLLPSFYGHPAQQMRTFYFAAVVSSFSLAYSHRSRSQIRCPPYFHTL